MEGSKMIVTLTQCKICKKYRIHSKWVKVKNPPIGVRINEVWCPECARIAKGMLE